ncbi:MAG: caspase family protein [Chloroflexi bacterium]|nr:caspase family protein [Chloroflexota bacterium]
MDDTNRNKWALLIGVNKYPKLPPDKQLDGCVNDVEVMAGLLQSHFGFPSGNITVMRDEEAHREGILTALDAFTSRVGIDDIVVVQYSGHGSQMTDREGDEPDGLDETIVPYDSGRAPYPNRDITDDEIHAWLVRVTEATPYVTLIFDCCHSGTITRDAFGDKSRWLEPDTRPIAELPPSPVDFQAARARRRDIGPSGWLPLGDRYVLLAGCQDDESSYEHTVHQNGQTVQHGALTYFLSQELLKAEASATYRDVFELASPRLTAAHPRQHPQMEGARDRSIFGVTDAKPMRFVQVTGRTEKQITLGGGAAHGLTAGSQWEIFARGTKRITEKARRLGSVEITTVRATTSDAKLVNEVEIGAVDVGGRAVEYAHFYGEMRLAVQISAPPGYETAVDRLEKLFKESGLLRLADLNQPADARVYLVPPRESAKKDDPAPQLGVVNQATWAVVGSDGKLMMPVHAVSEANAALDLRDNLEKAVRYRQALALRNPNNGSPLKGMVEFTLKRQQTDGSWAVAEPDTASGQVIFQEGDRIACRIANRYKTPFYVSLLDFGLSGGISQLYPPSGANEPLLPGNSIETGLREGDEIELYLPDNFPYVPDPTDASTAGGTETFKLIAATQPIDLSLLSQESYRGITRESTKTVVSPLNQLLDMALTGYGTRDARRNQLPPDEEWTTVERSFILRRKS